MTGGGWGGIICGLIFVFTGARIVHPLIVVWGCEEYISVPSVDNVEAWEKQTLKGATESLIYCGVSHFEILMCCNILIL